MARAPSGREAAWNWPVIVAPMLVIPALEGET